MLSKLLCIVNKSSYEKEQLKLHQSLLGVKGGGGKTSPLNSRVEVKYSTCTWYLYLSTYLSVLDVLEYLVYGNAKVYLYLYLYLTKKYLILTSNFKYYFLKSVKRANYLDTLL